MGRHIRCRRTRVLLGRAKERAIDFQFLTSCVSSLCILNVFRQRSLRTKWTKLTVELRCNSIQPCGLGSLVHQLTSPVSAAQTPQNLNISTPKCARFSLKTLNNLNIHQNVLRTHQLASRKRPLHAHRPPPLRNPHNLLIHNNRRTRPPRLPHPTRHIPLRGLEHLGASRNNPLATLRDTSRVRDARSRNESHIPRHHGHEEA